MNTFNPTILLENSPIGYESLEDYSSKEVGLLERMLEFNLDLQESYIDSSRKYYRALLEQDDTEVLNENVIGSIIDFIKSAIQGIIDFFSDLFGGGKSSSSSGSSSSSSSTSGESKDDKTKKNIAVEQMERARNKIDNYNKVSKSINDGIAKGGDPLSEIITVSMHKYRTDPPKFPQISDLYVNNTYGPDVITNVITNIRKVIDDILAGVPEGADKDEIEKQRDNRLTGIKNVITKCIKGTDDIKKVKGLGYIETENVDMKVSDFLSKGYAFFTSQSVQDIMKASFADGIPPEINDVISNLNGLCKDLDKHYSDNKLNIPKLRECIMLLTSYIDRFTNVYTVIIYELYKDISIDLNQHTKIAAKYLGLDLSAFKESDYSYIDDAFTIALYEYKEEINWAEFTQLVNEATILASENSSYEKMNQLMALDEAIAAKVKDAWKNFIAKVKNIFAKVSEAVASLGTTKRYLDKYKKVILGQNFVNETYRTRDIINAINRILSFGVPRLDYATQKDDLGDPIVYFNKHLKPAIRAKNGRDVDTSVGGISDPKNVQEIGTYCNDFFLGPKMEINTAEFQKRIKDIYDYMYDYSKISKRINKDIADVEKYCNEISKKAGITTVNDGVPADGDTDKDPTAAQAANGARDNVVEFPGRGKGTQSNVINFPGTSQEGYYSALYGTILTEEVIQEIEKVSTSNNTTDSDSKYMDSATGVVATNMTNVKGATRDTQNDDNKNAIGAADKTSAQAQIKNYAEVTCMVLRAKLTAVQFTHKEFDTLIRNHVKNYIENNTTKRDKEAVNQDMRFQ